MKTIPELEEDIKPIEEKINAIGQAISVDRPYNFIDISFISSQKQEIEGDLIRLAAGIIEVAQYTRKELKKRINFEIHSTAIIILQRAITLSKNVERLENLINNYLEIYDKHL